MTIITIPGRPNQMRDTRPGQPTLVITPGPLIDKLTIGGEIGRGTQGKVFAGRLGGTPVAVKVAAPGLEEELRYEATVLERLAGARVPLFHAHENDTLVMGLVAGRHPFSGGRGTNEERAEEIRSTIIAIAFALETVHSRGFVHRDVKPANVHIDGATATLLDLGLAYPAGKRGVDVCGSPEYMPADSFLPGEVHKEVDVYALTVMLLQQVVRVFEGLFGSEVNEMIRRKRRIEAGTEQVPVLPGPVKAIITKALGPKGRRPSDAAGFLEDFRRITVGDIVDSMPPKAVKP